MPYLILSKIDVLPMYLDAYENTIVKYDKHKNKWSFDTHISKDKTLGSMDSKHI